MHQLVEGKMYRHPAMRDVAIRVIWSKDKEEDKLEVYGTWFNTKYKCRIDEDIIEVKKADVCNWEEVADARSYRL